MSDTIGTHGADTPVRHRRVRELVDPAIALDLNETLSGFAANGDSRHAELSLRLDSIALLSLPISLKRGQSMNRSGNRQHSLSVPRGGGSSSRQRAILPCRNGRGISG